MASKSRLIRLFYLYAALLIILLGFAWRVDFLLNSHPYIDEYFTIVAARAVQEQGYPLIPSGLFYSHGFLYTYIVAFLGGLISVAGASDILQAEMVYRLPNLLISVGAMAMLYGVTRRWFGWQAGLVAVALMAIYPHGIVWGARVRMYTLVFLVVPFLAYAFYRVAANPTNKGWYALALLTFSAGVLAHNWVVLLVPLLLIGVIVVGWWSNRTTIRRWQWWLPGLTIIIIFVAISLYLQSLWLDTAETASQNRGWQGIGQAIIGRINPTTALSGNSQFLQQFVWNNSFNLVVLIGTVIGLVGLFLLYRAYRGQAATKSYFRPMLYLYILFMGIAAEFLLLLEPGLKQPRYASPILLLAFIILGGWTHLLLNGLSGRFLLLARSEALFSGALILMVLIGLGYLSYKQLPKIFYEGLPPVAYEKAFQFVRVNSVEDQTVLTPLPAAASLYLPDPGYFAAQNATNTFVHINTRGVLGDRWMGAPWLHTASQLKEVLQQHAVVWLVIDELSFESQFNSDWKQLMRYNTPQVWAEDGVMVFQGRGLRQDIPTEPEVLLDIQLADKIKLAGYSRYISPAGVRLVLFWQVLSALSEDYTIFAHIRNQAGDTVAQVDVQPLEGEYPTSRWRVGETVVADLVVPIPTEIPSGDYRLLVGLYRWDTLERMTVVNDMSGENAIELELLTVP